ncbi:MAG: MBL fold metallo-hydrolase [Tetrasphaera sp.]|nr:MBL fold metallo-hydrolase [Tetrasphaera sp.]
MTWAERDTYVEEVTRDVFAFIQPDGSWMVNNCGFVVGSSGRSVLVDTSSTERRTAQFMDAVRAHSSQPPMALVNTHHHPDHTYGNFLAPQGTPVVGHVRCREEVLAAGLEATKVITTPDYGNLELRPPDFTFTDRLTLHLDETPVELEYVGPAHTSNDVLVWLPEQKVVFAGDLAFAGGQPFLLEGSLAGFPKALARIKELGAEALVPGHGPVVRGADVNTLLDDLTGYVEFVSRIASEGMADGMTPLQVAEKYKDNPYSGWQETERLVGNLHRAYSELSGNDLFTRLRVPDVWPEMVSFHGGPIGCKA